LFAASVYSGLAGGFGADDGAVVSIEHFFATALAPVVVVIRTRGATQFQAFPLLTRVEAGNVALAAGGLTDEELVALTRTRWRPTQTRRPKRRSPRS